ncbi:MerR family DNA-binding transcriptional regulator, partial [Candidatus Enterococcus testudinis]|uniref:MerR family DNA-binding transcriptional regulator n=1 Tax=Candidatus Enterococcus testudinis TaxID=1834191 RepID=UPI00211A5C35
MINEPVYSFNLGIFKSQKDAIIINTKEVAEMLDLTVDRILYYERFGIILSITRDKNSYRV